MYNNEIYIISRKMMIYCNCQIRDFRRIRASCGDQTEDDDQGLSFAKVYDEGGTKGGS